MEANNDRSNFSVSTMMEDEEQEEVIPFSPNKDDVICTRKQWRYAHPGNIHYGNLVNQCALQLISQRQELLNPDRCHQQTTTTTTKKAEMVNSILDDVMVKRQGRFLRPTDDSEGFCIVLSRSDAARKVGFAITKKRNRVQSVQAAEAAAAEAEAAAVAEAVVPTYRAKKKKTTKKVTMRTKKIISSKKQLTSKVKTKKTTKTKYATSMRSDLGFDSDDETENLGAVGDVAATAEPPSLLCPPSNSWTLDRLYHHRRHHEGDRNNHNIGRHHNPHQSSSLYGSPQDEIEMRRWLNKNRLPQSVGDVLLSHGARNIDDVMLLVQSQPSLLKDLAVLDALKLRRAVQGNPL